MSEFNFKYHPDPLNTKAFRNDETVTCSCCGNKTDVYYTTPFFTSKEVDYLCPKCIASGEAAKKFDGEFNDPYAAKGVSDPDKTDELVHRTPSYHSWQEPVWLSHCDDYCAYLGAPVWDDLEKMGIDREIEETYRNGIDGMTLEDLKEHISVNGCYLFKCLHCNKHFIHIDFD